MLCGGDCASCLHRQFASGEVLLILLMVQPTFTGLLHRHTKQSYCLSCLAKVPPRRFGRRHRAICGGFMYSPWCSNAVRPSSALTPIVMDMDTICHGCNVLSLPYSRPRHRVMDCRLACGFAFVSRPICQRTQYLEWRPGESNPGRPARPGFLICRALPRPRLRTAFTGAPQCQKCQLGTKTLCARLHTQN